MSTATDKGNVTTLSKVVRSTAGLRDVLFDEIDRIRNGETDAKKANAVARLASEIVNSVQLEMEVQKYAASLPSPPKPAVKAPVSISFTDAA